MVLNHYREKGCLVWRCDSGIASLGDDAVSSNFGDVTNIGFAWMLEAMKLKWMEIFPTGLRQAV